MEAACVNQAGLLGRPSLHAYFSAAFTVWVKPQSRYGLNGKVLPDWGPRMIVVNFTVGDLAEIAELEAKAYTAKNR